MTTQMTHEAQSRRSSIMTELIGRVIFPLNEIREGTQVGAHLRRLNQTERDENALKSVRREKLTRLLTHAYTNTTLYKKKFDDAGIHPSQIRDFDDLRLIPPLTKDELRTQLDSIIAKNIGQCDLRRGATGGSTGTRTPFFRDKQCMQIKQGSQYRFYNWAGWSIGDRYAQIWPALQDIKHITGIKEKLRQRLLDRRLLLPAGKLDNETIARHCARLHDFNPSFIRGFPNPLALIAQHLRNEKRYRVRPKGVVTMGEPLLDSQRQLFEEVFSCPVYNCYVSRECGHMASECEEHDGLHVSAELLHIEFADNGVPVAPGTMGTILVTDFENFGMPFIRYEIGDMGRAIGDACACGRVLPRISMDAGRVSDFVKSPKDGALVAGSTLCHYFLVEGPDVGQIQIEQDRLDHLIIRFTRPKQTTLNFDHIKKVTHDIFGEAMAVTFSEVEKIPREASGKYRFCLSTYAQRESSSQTIES